MGKSSNRIGKEFEDKLTRQFEKYRKENKAYIFKCFVDWVVIRGKMGKVVNCYPRKESNMLDFCGFLPNGKHIILEAKSYDAVGKKMNKPFSLSNIKEYQFAMNKELYQYTDNIFYVIEARLSDHNETFLLHADKLQEFVDNNDRKSIPYETLKEIAIQMDDLDILKYL